MSYVTEKIYIIIQRESLSVQHRLLSLGIVIKSKIANWKIRNCQRKRPMTKRENINNVQRKSVKAGKL